MVTFSSVFLSLPQKNSNYIVLHKKTAFGINFGLFEVPKLDDDEAF